MPTNKITSTPPMPKYSPDMNGALLSRELMLGLLDKLDGNAGLPPVPGTPTGNELTNSTASAVAATPGSEEPQTPTLSSNRSAHASTSQSQVLTQGELLRIHSNNPLLFLTLVHEISAGTGDSFRDRSGRWTR
jgi:hypothetical protein